MTRRDNELLVRPRQFRGLPARAGAGSPARVWLVDDRAELRGLIAELLGSRDGILCEREFSSAEEVVAALGAQPAPDVILLDIHMHGMNGIEALAPIRSLAGSTRVLMLTTFYDSIKESAALRAGASGFLLKTCSVEDLASRIEQAMAGPTLGERARSVTAEPGVLRQPASLRADGAVLQDNDKGFRIWQALAELWRGRSRAASEL